jgi:hypothetical protein
MPPKADLKGAYGQHFDHNASKRLLQLATDADGDRGQAESDRSGQSGHQL